MRCVFKIKESTCDDWVKALIYFPVFFTVNYYTTDANMVIQIFEGLQK